MSSGQERPTLAKKGKFRQAKKGKERPSLRMRVLVYTQATKVTTQGQTFICKLSGRKQQERVSKQAREGMIRSLGGWAVGIFSC